MLKKEGLDSISDKLNPFFIDILLNLSELLAIKDEHEKDIINILSQPIWLFYVFFINDIISEDKQFLSYQEFQNKYMISTNFLEYYGIVGAVPKR